MRVGRERGAHWGAAAGGSGQLNLDEGGGRRRGEGEKQIGEKGEGRKGKERGEGERRRKREEKGGERGEEEGDKKVIGKE